MRSRTKMCDIALYSLYVDVIVHVQEASAKTVVFNQSVMVLPPSSIPGNIGPYNDGVQWYIAARYEYDDYSKWLASKEYQLGSGTLTTYSGGTYINQPLESGSTYAIYIRVVWADTAGVSVILVKNLVIVDIGCVSFQKLFVKTSDGISTYTSLPLHGMF